MEGVADWITAMMTTLGACGAAFVWCFSRWEMTRRPECRREASYEWAFISVQVPDEEKFRLKEVRLIDPSDVEFFTVARERAGGRRVGSACGRRVRVKSGHIDLALKKSSPDADVRPTVACTVVQRPFWVLRRTFVHRF